MDRIDVRHSRFDDLDSRTAYALWQLRESVFVVEQNCPYPELDGRDLEPGTRHLWVQDGKTPVAYLRLLDDAGAARIGRVLVARSHRGRGLAAAMMRQAIELVDERDLVLDAQSYLVAWYSRFGFTPSGPEFLEDGIPHIPMHRPVPRS